MNLHTEVLPPDQQAALRKLGRPATEAGFFLGGGTAVAIHLGHRQSLDLDWSTLGRIGDTAQLAKNSASSRTLIPNRCPGYSPTSRGRL
jgi:hypothetical protein